MVSTRLSSDDMGVFFLSVLSLLLRFANIHQLRHFYLTQTTHLLYIICSSPFDRTFRQFRVLVLVPLAYQIHSCDKTPSAWGRTSVRNNNMVTYRPSIVQSRVERVEGHPLSLVG
jgi:hypothetical protein